MFVTLKHLLIMRLPYDDQTFITVTLLPLTETHILSMKASVRQKRHSYLDRCKDNPKYCPYRTADGSNNNLDNPTWGKSDEPHRRCLNNAYDDGMWVKLNVHVCIYSYIYTRVSIQSQLTRQNDIATLSN